MKRKIITILAICVFGILSVNAFIVNDLIQTALHEGQYYTQEIKKQFEWLETLKSYSDQWKQIQTYYDQLKGIDFKDINSLKQSADIVGKMELTVENTARGVHNLYEKKKKDIENLEIDTQNKLKISRRKFDDIIIKRTNEFFGEDGKNPYSIKGHQELVLAREKDRSQMWQEQAEIHEEKLNELNKAKDDVLKVVEESNKEYDTLKNSLKTEEEKYNNITLSESDTVTQAIQKQELRQSAREIINNLKNQIKTFEENVIKKHQEMMNEIELKIKDVKSDIKFEKSEKYQIDMNIKKLEEEFKR